MKGYKDVDATRMQQRTRPALNSVHRSSLLVPQIEGAHAEVTFLNHFLIKRNYPHVGCRITAIDRTGRRIESQLHPIVDRRVYRFGLSEMFENAASYQIEFFAAENLFIPFPAVMVNHYGPGFINTVHAFNRVLNDVFEDDELQRLDVAESGIEVTLSEEIDTVIWPMGGMAQTDASIELTLDTAEGSMTATTPLRLSRFGVQPISVGSLFPRAGSVKNGVLRVRQPHQTMFYGRMLGARVVRSTGAFSGNHSYYDTRALDETWEDAAPSSQIFGYKPGLRPRIRIHPEFPAGRANALSLTFFDKDGAVLSSVDAGELRNPGPYLELDIEEMLARSGIDPAAAGSFELCARPIEGKSLTRIAYHMVYGNSGLEGSSIIALNNPNVKPRDPSKGRTWGQAIVGREYETLLAIGPGFRSEAVTHCRLEFYDERGPLAIREYELVPNGGLVLDVERELTAEIGSTLEGRDHASIWFYLDADRSDINAHAVTRHRKTGNTTVEHTF